MSRGVNLIIALTLALIALGGALMSVSHAVPPLTIEEETGKAHPLEQSVRPLVVTSGLYAMYDTLTPSDVPTATYQWIEIGDDPDFTWNLGGGPNDVSDSYPVGFLFPFYNSFYSSFRVSEKGYIQFSAPVDVGSGRVVPGQIPNPDTSGDVNNFIAPFGADVIGYPGISQVYIRNDNNPRRTIIQYENVVWCCGQYNPRTFQIILYPDGSIKMQYAKITNFPGDLDDNQIVRVGLENEDGSLGDVYTQGIFYPDNNTVWQDNMALLFVPDFDSIVTFFSPNSDTVWDDPGINIYRRAGLNLGATEFTTRTFRLTHSLVVSSNVPASVWEANINYPTAPFVVSSDENMTPTFIVSVPTVITNYNDYAEVTFTAISTDFQPISATYHLTYGPAQRDLVLTKTINPDIPPAPNGAFRYRFQVENNDFNNSDRSGIAREVVITDLLPENMLLQDDNCGCVTTETVGSQMMITLTLGDISPYGSRNIVLEMRNLNGLPGTGTATLPAIEVSNTGYLTTTSLEVGPTSNNVSTAVFTTATEYISDLTINKSYPFDPDTVASGQPIPFRLEFYNQGNFPITTATIIDLLPPYATFYSAFLSSHGPYLTPGYPVTPTISGPMSRTLTFDIPVVDNGDWNHTHLDIWVLLPQTTPIGSLLTNTVIISDGVSQGSDDQEIIITDNHVNPIITKHPSLDLEGNVIPPVPGQDYTYWIEYRNRSTTVSADNVIITDTFPPSVTLVSATAGQYLTGPVVSLLPGGTVILPPYGTTILPGTQLELTWYGTQPIPPGGSGIIAVIVHIGEDVPPGTLLANVATITYTGEFSPSDTNDGSDEVIVEVVSQIQGSTKTVDNPTPVAGEIINYTIVVSNASPTQTINFGVNDPLPNGGLTYISHNPPSTGIVTVTGNTIWWTGSGLAPLDTASLVFQARTAVTAPVNSTIRNTAYISSGTINIARHADVTIAGGVFGNSSKTADPTVVRSGDIFTYTLVAANTGAGSETITITDNLPPEVSFVPNSFNGPGSAVANGNTITWTTFVSAETSNTLTFQVAVADGLANGDTIVNTAELLTAGGEPVLLQATVNVANPDFSTSSKSASDPIVAGGSLLQYTVTAANSGASGAVITVTDTLPISVTLNPGSFSDAVTVSGDNQTFTWTTFVAATSNETLTFEVQIDTGLPNGSTIDNVAYLTDDIGSAPLPLVATVLITSASNFEASSKVVTYTGSTVSSGDTVSYTITAVNTGISGDTATITDTLPPGLVLNPVSFVPQGGSVNSNGNAFTWTVFVPAQGSRQLTFAADVAFDLPDGEVITNVAILDTPNIESPVWMTASFSLNNPILTASGKSVNSETAAGGEVLTYTIWVDNAGSLSATVVVSDVLPADVTLDPNSFNLAGDVISDSTSFIWTPIVPPYETISLTFQVTVNLALMDGTVLENRAYLNHQTLSQPLALTASTTIRSVNFSTSSKTASVTGVSGNDIFTYTLTAINSGSLDGEIMVVDTIPAGLSLLANSIVPTSEVGNVITNGNTITWTTTVSGYSQKQLHFRAVVIIQNLPDGAPIVNQATMNIDGFSKPVIISNTILFQKPLLGGSSKSASLSTVTGGDIFTYTITVSNTGSGSSYVSLSDDLPDGLILLPDTFEHDYVGTFMPPMIDPAVDVDDPNSFIWTPYVEAYHAVILTFQVQVTAIPTDGLVLNNIAYLQHPSIAPLPLSTAVTYYKPGFGLSSKTASAEVVSGGDMLTYTITVSNTGSIGGLATVSDNLPNEVTLVSGSFVPAGEVALNGSSFTWTPTVDAGTQATLSFRVIVTEVPTDGHQIDNVAWLDHGSLPQPWPLTATVTFVRGDFSSSSKTASETTVSSDQVFSYTLTAQNSGSATREVVVTDALPPEVSLLANSFSPATEAGNVSSNGNVITWTTTVAGNAANTLSFAVQVGAEVPDETSFTNQATLRDTHDASTYPLSTTVTVANVVFTGSNKSVSPTIAGSGDTVTYTITLDNSGSASGSAVVVDTLPAPLSLLPNSFSPQNGVIVNGNTFTWTRTVNSGTIAQLTFQATISDPNGTLVNGTTIVNQATLSHTSLAEPMPISATLTIENVETGYEVYLPLLLK